MRRPALDGECYTEAEWHRNAKRTRDAVPNLWSLDEALRQSPGVDTVLSIMLQEGLALSRSLPFLVAFARMISLPVHPHTQAKASEMSPFEWCRKDWSREHFFAQVGMALDPGNCILARGLWSLMAFANALPSEARLLDAANGCAKCLATGLVQEVSSWWWSAGEDVVASTASGSRAASASGRPSPQPGLLKYLLLRLQCQMPSVRFGCAEQSHNEN